MNTEFEDIEDEPLSNDNPIDWYYDGYDGETGNGYANQCMISIFSDYIRKHDLTIKVWGVSFDNERPLVESKKLRLDVIEEDKKSQFIWLKLQPKPETEGDFDLHIEFDDDFYFSFFESFTDGSESELDYYDDYCMK